MSDAIVFTDMGMKHDKQAVGIPYQFMGGTIL